MPSKDRKMPYLDWSQCPALERDPERCSGAVTFKGTRSMLATVFANIGSMSIDELVVQYGIPREQIEEVMEFLEESCEPVPSL
jgi:uncharacterized protein (DUF433 family)